MQGLLFDPVSDLAGAIFDETRTYRYLLWRRWSKGAPLLWVMLNPSDADESEPDPTLRCCHDFSARLGFAALEIVNLYAFQSSKPKDLWKVDDPVGPDNDEHIAAAIDRAALVIVAWGRNAKRKRIDEVVELMRQRGVKPFCLRTIKNGQPEHPLYLPRKLLPVPWIEAA